MAPLSAQADFGLRLLQGKKLREEQEAKMEEIRKEQATSLEDFAAKMQAQTVKLEAHANQLEARLNELESELHNMAQTNNKLKIEVAATKDSLNALQSNAQKTIAGKLLIMT